MAVLLIPIGAVAAHAIEEQVLKVEPACRMLVGLFGNTRKQMEPFCCSCGANGSWNESAWKTHPICQMFNDSQVQVQSRKNWLT